MCWLFRHLLAALCPVKPFLKVLTLTLTQFSLCRPMSFPLSVLNQGEDSKIFRSSCQFSTICRWTLWCGCISKSLDTDLKEGIGLKPVHGDSRCPDTFSHPQKKQRIHSLEKLNQGVSGLRHTVEGWGSPWESADQISRCPYHCSHFLPFCSRVPASRHTPSPTPSPDKNQESFTLERLNSTKEKTYRYWHLRGGLPMQSHSIQFNRQQSLTRVSNPFPRFQSAFSCLTLK